MRGRVVLAVFTAMIAILCAVPEPALACSPPPGWPFSPEQNAQRAALIFAGSVAEIRLDLPASSGTGEYGVGGSPVQQTDHQHPYAVVFRVEAAWKGVDIPVA